MRPEVAGSQRWRPQFALTNPTCCGHLYARHRPLNTAEALRHGPQRRRAIVVVRVQIDGEFRNATDEATLGARVMLESKTDGVDHESTFA